jgi:hypothetical protein
MAAVDPRHDWPAAAREAAMDWSWLAALLRGWPA